MVFFFFAMSAIKSLGFYDCIMIIIVLVYYFILQHLDQHNKLRGDVLCVLFRVWCVVCCGSGVV